MRFERSRTPLQAKIQFAGLALAAIALLMSACQPAKSDVQPDGYHASAAVTEVGQQRYNVEQRIVLRNLGPGAPEKQNLWVALIRDLRPYQEVTSLSITPHRYTPVTDEYGNQYAEFDFSGQPAGAVETVIIRTQVVVHELTYDLSNCNGSLPDEFTQPELHIESANPQIVQLAQSLVARNDTVCEKARAFYDYVGKELVYTPNEQSWGAQATLGPMGADCTEYTSLLIALSRTQGIPARYFEGLRYLETGVEAGARIEHAWPDVYMPEAGWVAMDPTLGHLPLSRETYFAHYTPDHIIVTLGRNPSTLRGSSYWTHLYWPGNAARIIAEAAEWRLELAAGQD